MDEMVILEQVVAAGDLSKLSPTQRVQWYKMRCDAAGLDYRTQPFQYITLQGKLTLYATKTATEQLCLVRGISTQIVTRERADDLAIVVCRAVDRGGRYTDSMGAVSVAGLRGDALANALMKAETKAKRRAVLSLSGLGMLDETETETIPGAVVEPLVIPPALPAPTVEAEPEPRPEPTPAEKVIGHPANGDKPAWYRGEPTGKQATVSGGLWQVEAPALAQEVAYYQKNGRPDFYHMCGAAGKCGIAVIDDANVQDVIAALKAYAAAQH